MTTDTFNLQNFLSASSYSFKLLCLWLWSMGAFSYSGAGTGVGAGLDNFWKNRVWVRWLKNYLKYSYLYFLYIFTIKIFLKSTLYVLGSQNKERRRQEIQNKKDNTKEVTNIQNKIEEWQISDV